MTRITIANKCICGIYTQIRESSTKGWHIRTDYAFEEYWEDSGRRAFRKLGKIEVTYDRKGKLRASQWRELTLEEVYKLDSYQNCFIPETEKKEVKKNE